MKFGIRLLQYLGSPQELVRLSVLAEKHGFDCVWFPHDTFMYNTWALTAAVATATRKINIASIATNPYTTDPSEIATYLATLDLLSNGRATIGIGLHTEEMVEWTGIKVTDVITRTREAVDIVRKLLKGEIVDYKGTEFRWTRNCYLRFKPLRSDVPIYVAAFGPQYIQLSGEIGDGSLPMITPPESAAYMFEHIKRGAKHAGRDVSEVDFAGCAWFSISEDRRAAAELIRTMIAYFAPYLEEPALNTVGLTLKQFKPIKAKLAQADYDGAAALVTEEMYKLAVVGTADDCIEKIEQMVEMGVTQVSIGGPIGPDVEAAIRLVGEKVIPYFR